MPGASGEVDHPDILRELLAEARAAGFLGPGSLERQLHHAAGFATIARRLHPAGSARLLDLGSGGGLPGLVVAADWSQSTMVLLEVNGRRAAFLRQAVERLQLGARVSVLEERAEVAGRRAPMRAGFDAVMARSFGRPAVVAECAAPLLRVGGWLIVSEPPPTDVSVEEGDRWPVGPLRSLGLEPVEGVHEDFAYRILRQTEACPDRFPRRDGVPAKKPLF